MGPRKLDGRFNPFASRRSKEGLIQPPARSRTQPFRQLSRKVSYMGLNHCRAAACQLSLKRLYDLPMIVPHVVNAVA
jgi:hypothetical protein